MEDGWGDGRGGGWREGDEGDSGTERWRDGGMTRRRGRGLLLSQLCQRCDGQGELSITVFQELEVREVLGGGHLSHEFNCFSFEVLN